VLKLSPMITLTIAPITPFGYTNLPVGDWPIFSYRDFLRPTIYPVINVPTSGDNGSQYTWYFAQSPTQFYSPLGQSQNSETAMSGTYSLPLQLPTHSAVVEVNKVLPVVMAWQGGRAEGQHGSVLYGATARESKTEGSYIFNGGECLEINASIMTAVPSGCTLRVEFDLVKYSGGYTGHIALPDYLNCTTPSSNPQWATPSAGYILFTPGSSCMYRTMNVFPKFLADDSVTLNPAVDPTFSLHTGYIGVRILRWSYTCPDNVAWAQEIHSIDFSVTQFAPVLSRYEPSTGQYSSNCHTWDYIPAVSAAIPMDLRYSGMIVQAEGGSNQSRPGTLGGASKGNNELTLTYVHALFACPVQSTVIKLMANMSASRTNSASVLLTNVTSDKDKEGTVYSATTDEGEGWSDVDMKNVKVRSQSADTGYAGPLAKGSYTWFRPSPSAAPSAAMAESYVVADYTGAAYYPMIQLDDTNVIHVQLISDPITSTATCMLLRASHHVEYTTAASGIVQQERTTMSVAAYEEIAMALLRAPEFTENWIHLDQLWRAIKSGATTAVKAGMGAAAKAALSEIASGLSVLML